MSKIIKIITILLICLGIQMTGIILCNSFLEDNTFAYIGAIGSFIWLTSILIIKALEVEE